MTKWNIAPVALAAALFMAAPAQAQVAFGPQVSYGTDSDLGVGARVELPVGGMITQDAGSMMAGLKAIGSFDWFFLDCDDDAFGGVEVDCSYWEANVNGAVPFVIEGQGFSPYLGAGLNIAQVAVEVGDFDESETEIGVNILGGLNFPLGGLAAFAEGRIELGGGEQFVISAGVLF